MITKALGCCPQEKIQDKTRVTWTDQEQIAKLIKKSSINISEYQKKLLIMISTAVLLTLEFNIFDLILLTNNKLEKKKSGFWLELINI